MSKSDNKDNSKPSLARRGAIPASASRPVATPIFPSVVYAAESADTLDAQYEGALEGYTYAREGHPNADMLAATVDHLEGAEGGIVTASGMAAISAMFLGVLKAGDHILAGDQLYGRSLRMLGQDLPRIGFQTSFADSSDVAAIKATIRPNTRMIMIEAVSNPTLRVADITGISELAAAHGALLVVDNTFTTPAMFRPMEHGADIVINSITKFLAGHSDLTLGYVAARDPRLRNAIYDAAVTWGTTPSPFDCWLAERGLHTFDLRFEKAQATAAALADALAGRDGIRQVIYPGRADHPQHNRAGALFGGQFGNMLSFEIEGGRDEVNSFVMNAGGIPFAPTLGDVGCTLSHPASSSHRALTEEGRAALGISEGFFRLSVGIEPPELVLAELDDALAAVRGES